MAGHAKAKPRKGAPIPLPKTVRFCQRSYDGIELVGRNMLTARPVFATTNSTPCEIVDLPAPCDYALSSLDPFRCDRHGHMLLLVHDAITPPPPQPTQETPKEPSR